MSDIRSARPNQEDGALPMELAPLDVYLLAEGQRWRRTEPSTAQLERHVRSLVQAGERDLRSGDALLTDHATPHRA
ncbi:MAG TPA: hypothetical protein VF808_03615 [Ktedonobacterales bacterium]